MVMAFQDPNQPSMDMGFMGGYLRQPWEQQIGPTGQPGTTTQPAAPTQYDPAVAPPTGETPLSGFQHVATSGGSDQAAHEWAFQDFQKQFGRNPTQSELDRLATAYSIGDPNLLDLGRGKSGIAEYYQSLTNTPANLYARQQKQWEQNAPQHYDAVKQIIQGLYGRDATQDEINHYSTLIASGQADPYQIQQFLMSTPEYQNAQDKNFRQGLTGELESSDQSFFNRAKGDIIQKYAEMGRATSPALDVALTDLASQLNEKRGNYLAQLSASQYGGNKAAAMSSYADTNKQIQDRINQNTSGVYSNWQDQLNRSRSIQDYTRQSEDWQRAMQNAQQKPGWMDYLNTGLNVINAGANVYGAANGVPPSGGKG